MKSADTLLEESEGIVVNIISSVVRGHEIIISRFISQAVCMMFAFPLKDKYKIK